MRASMVLSQIPFLGLVLAGSFLQAQERPNHLVTIPPFFGGYHSEVYRRLLPDDAWRGPWMVVFPSFQPEYSVQIIPSEMDQAEPYRVRVTASNIESWRVYGPQPPPPSPRVKKGPKRPSPSRVKIRSQEVPLPSDLAALVLRAWQSALLGTRNVEEPDTGFDGATYHFFNPPRMYGGTWSPEGGVPRDMVELGNALLKYAEGKPAEREALLKELREQAEKVIAETTPPSKERR